MLETAVDAVLGRLAHPVALWLLVALPALGVLAVLAARRRRRALQRLGSGLALRALTTPRRPFSTFRALCWTAGLLALVAGIAGPRWGTDPSQQVASGRDLVVVLDLSRSMLAEQPSRLERARRALIDLADSLQRQGGHRVALVLFAARAKLVCPLTHDYDHFRDTVRAADAELLPVDLRPVPDGPPSGTRIGAALRVAIEAHDTRLAGYQDVLLVSDGDDPGGDDEWVEGAELARERGILVSCLGVGDPAAYSTIPTSEGPLTFDGKVVRTRLEEQPLIDLARRTNGEYVPGQTRPLPRDALFHTVLMWRRWHDNPDILLPVQRPRYPWFYGPALGLFAVALLLGVPPPRPRREPKEERP